MGFLVTRFRFFHRLGTDGENMFEKTIVRSTTQKVFTHRHERGKVRDGIGRKMVELGTEEVQEAPEEGVWREQKNRSTWVASSTHSPGRGCGSISPSGILAAPLAISPDSASSSRSSYRSKDRIQSPWIEPGGIPACDDDPRFCFLPFAAPIAFFKRSSTAVLSFTMVAERRRREQKSWM